MKKYLIHLRSGILHLRRKTTGAPPCGASAASEEFAETDFPPKHWRCQRCERTHPTVGPTGNVIAGWPQGGEIQP